MQQPRNLNALRIYLQRILDTAFARQTGAARVQLLGLFTLIYLLQSDKADVTARRLSLMRGQPQGHVGNQVKKLVALDLIERTQVPNKQGRGRAFKLTIKHGAPARRLTKAIDKAAGGRGRK